MRTAVAGDEPNRRYINTDKGREPVLTYQEALARLVELGVLEYE